MGFKRVPRRKMSTDGVIDLRFFERVAIPREMTTSFLAIWRVCGNLFLGSRSSVPIPACLAAINFHRPVRLRQTVWVFPGLVC